MGSGLLQPTHLIILAVVLLVVFGPKRIPDVAKSLGSGMRGFKDSLQGGDDHAAVTKATADEAAPARD
ncbi:twin-arginine translocase TatA/TatE family subunit [Patulibacter sp. SYSU D01012]|uniref:twin-arginine translocase TatA/TatE family subunit n=1 Tax=Patulibacter sp. SYSU D01012 TaxID=2817381 RepID=UPI001B30AD99|nr:twin-arginine translocase TatA/TatE family subunit [Patulibacter sp. SYSU D01012]